MYFINGCIGLVWFYVFHNANTNVSIYLLTPLVT